MADLATIGIGIDSSQITTAKQELQRLGTAFNSAERSASVFVQSFDRAFKTAQRDIKYLKDSARAFQDLVNKANNVTNAYKSAEESASVFSRELQKSEQIMRNQARAFVELVNQVNTYKKANKSAEESAAVFVKVLREQENQALKTARAHQQAINTQFGITRATKSAADSASVFAQALERQEAQVIRTGAATNVSMRSQNQFGLVTQQVGYQVGDFVVQVQSGTNAFVAFGQQATQLAGLLYLIPTAAGAIAGTVASILIPTMTAALAYFSRTGEAAKTLQETLQDLADDTQTYQRLSESLQNALVIPMDDASRALKEYLELRKQAASGDIIQQTRGALGRILKPTIDMQRALEQQLATEAVIGRPILEAELELVKKINETLAMATVGPAEELGIRLVEAIDELERGGELIDSLREPLQQLLEDTGLLEQAEEANNVKRVEALALAAQQEEAANALLQARIEERQEQDRLNQLAKEALGRYANMRTVSAQLAENTRLAAENFLRLRQFEGTAAGQALGRYGGRGTTSGRALVANFDLTPDRDRTTSRIRVTVNLTRELTAAEQQRLDVLQTIENSLESGFMSMVDGTKSVKDFVARGADIIAELYRVLVVQRIVGSIMGFIDPSPAMLAPGIPKPPPRPAGLGRASGGSIMPGGAYLVGEKGPEIIRPRHSGTVVPAHLSGQGGSSLTVQNNITVTGSDAANVRMEVAKMIPQITEATKAAVIDARRRGGQMKAAFG